MKKLIINTIFFILRMIGGSSFSNRLYNPFVLFRFLFYQKILRINATVPWPVHFTSKVVSPQKIEKGTRNPGMSMNCYIDGRNGIIFGKNVWIGPKVSIISMNHEINDYTKYIKTESISIDDDCWIGANATILPGVKLGKHVIVGAGSVVTKSFEKDNILIAGCPAKIIKEVENYKH